MKPNAGPESASSRALITLLQTADTVWDASRVFFERWKISPSQFNVLNLLGTNVEGLSQTELSRRLIVHRSNVTGLVDRLENRGLVVRRTVELDRRAYRVVLTREGAALLQEVLPEYYAASSRLWQVVSAKRLGQLVADLEAVSANAMRIAQAVEQQADSQAVRQGSKRNSRV